MLTSPHRRTRTGQGGFTLAGLIVILTIIAIFIAYTVPKQWSKILQREREKQTIFVMRQYARAIYEYNKKNNSLPVSMDQIKQARLPRLIRGFKGEMVDPLTGKVDWILLPPGAVTGGGPLGQPQLVGSAAGGVGVGGTGGGAAGGASGGAAGGATPAPGTPGAPQSTPKLNLQASPKDYVGPFIGVRPPITGKSILTYRDSDTYEGWFYTVQDLQREIQLATTQNPNSQ